MKATGKTWSLVALLALSALPQQALSQVRPSKPPATPAAIQLVPGQGMVAVARAPSRGLVSVQHVERVNLVGLGGRIYSTGLDEVYVRIVPVHLVSWKRERPYTSHIYLLAPGKKRFLGSNFDDRVVRLASIRLREASRRVPVSAIRISSRMPKSPSSLRASWKCVLRTSLGFRSGEDSGAVILLRSKPMRIGTSSAT